MSKINGLDLRGDRYGNLTVIGYLGKKLYGDREYNLWECLCICGKITESITSNLRNGQKNKSCGCKREESRLEKIKKGSGEASLSWLYRTYKRRAKLKGMRFTLDLKQFKSITSSDCFYCGDEPAQSANNHRNNGTYIYNGIDRIDSGLGYNENNCRPACGRCNKAKNVMNESDFFSWIENLYNRHIKDKQDG